MAARQAALAAVAALASLVFVGGAPGTSDAAVRVTVFGDSAATAMAYTPEARRILERGIDLRLELAVCRRVGDTSCPYDGVRPPNVIDRATELGPELGQVVVVVVGYNDYEDNYAGNIANAMAVFHKAGVQRVLWTTLREVRQSYAQMNETIADAARKFPEMTVVDWDAVARQQPGWLQSDGIHLTPAGAQGMATMIRDALVQVGVAPPPPQPKAPMRLAISSRRLPAGHAGLRYTASLRAIGGKAPYRWVRVRGALPPGVTLRANGRLVGVPRRTGTYHVRVLLVDRAGTARGRVFSLRVI